MNQETIASRMQEARGRAGLSVGQAAKPLDFGAHTSGAMDWCDYRSWAEGG